MNHKLALVLIGTLVISGCASNKPTVSLNNPTQVAQSVSIEEDKFEKTTTYSAVDIRKNNGIERLYLNAIKTQNPAIPYTSTIAMMLLGDIMTRHMTQMAKSL